MLKFHPLYEDVSPALPRGGLLFRLFRTALYALKEEDALLSKAIAQAPPAFESFYAQSNHGLGHWILQTDIIYSLYRAWLPFVPLAWEKRNPLKPDQMDLVVYADFPDIIEGEQVWRPKLICEAKWWMDNSVATQRALKTDFEMMQHWESDLDKRVLIGLWYWNAEALAVDSDEFKVLRQEIASHVSIGEIEMLYLGAFPTDFNRVGTRGDEGYFCVGFFRKAH